MVRNNNVPERSSLRKTPERAAILAALTKATEPLSAEQLAVRVKKVAHTATVYRALGALVELGLVRRLTINPRVALYELNLDHHHHIVCTGCGIIEDVHREPQRLEATTLAQSKRFAAISTHSLEFFGLCKQCI